MKKLLAALLLVLLLSGCQGRSDASMPPSQPEEVEQPVSNEPVVETPTVEIPAEIVPNQEDGEAAYTLDRMERLEGQVEDSIGYILEYPVFSGFDAAETVNQFYVDLAAYLEGYTKETVYAEVMERFTIANVYGLCERMEVQEGQLAVEYAFSIHFYDTDEDVVKTRTDYFDMSTGEVTSEVD